LILTTIFCVKITRTKFIASFERKFLCGGFTTLFYQKKSFLLQRFDIQKNALLKIYTYVHFLKTHYYNIKIAPRITLMNYFGFLISSAILNFVDFLVLTKFKKRIQYSHKIKVENFS